MAHNYVTTGNRLTMGSQGGAGISQEDKIPYESSDDGGLSILNGPVQIGHAPLSNPPKGVLYVGPTVVSSGPIAESAVYVDHGERGIKIESDKIGLEIIAGTENKITAPENFVRASISASRLSISR